jgi:hypothetical protein
MVQAQVSNRTGADDNFYVWMAMTIALVVAAGFGPTMNAQLIHPSSPRPWILYLHAALFTSWVLLFATQAALVRSRRIAWHRRLGIFSIVIGTLMPPVGIATALTMTRLHRTQNFEKTIAHDERFLIVSLFDMLAFAVTFGLAIFWRSRSEYHRRLMLIASCGLTVAAFARLPNWAMPANLWYFGVDMLILAGAARDWIITHRIHRAYLYGLAIVVLGQAVTMWIYLTGPPAWRAIAHGMLE